MNGVPGTTMAPWGKVLGEQGPRPSSTTSSRPGRRRSTPKLPTSRADPAANPVAFSPESVARGEAIFLDRCWGCHGKKADGNGPNAADILPRPRNLRNTPFVTSLPYTRLHESIKYGVQGTAMPPPASTSPWTTRRSATSSTSSEPQPARADGANGGRRQPQGEVKHMSTSVAAPAREPPPSTRTGAPSGSAGGRIALLRRLGPRRPDRRRQVRLARRCSATSRG